jgi:prepilin-type processing-associated H-X9-DG protein
MSGAASAGGTATDPTNYVLLEECLLYPYSGSVKIYKCPAGTVVNPVSQLPTCRSYSVNTYMNGYDVGCNHQDDWPSNTIFLVQTKLSLVASPGPSKRMVFVDESPDTIDVGNFSVVPTGGGYTVDDWWNCASARHANACGFSYADGHVADITWSGTQLQAWEKAVKVGNEDGVILSASGDLQDLLTVQNGQAMPNGQN